VTETVPALVVGVAIVRDGRLLIARRTGPADLTGRWELPGGKVEPGESVEHGAVREIAEELGSAITMTAHLPDRYRLNERFDMVVVRADIDPSAEPIPTGSHDAVAWLNEVELESAIIDPVFPWVPADVPALTAVHAARWLAPV
jgi:8-oxo-dGTP diphosphatase